MNKIKIVGLGPGSKDYILPIVSKSIKEADIVVGGSRNLESIDITGKETMEIGNNLEDVSNYIRANYKKKKIVVLVSGDPGYYSFLRYIKRNFNKEEYEVITGIGSMQYMFARIGESWEDAYIGSLHGREIDFINITKEIKKVGLLTDKKWTPKKIAAELVNNNLGEKRIYIGENLSYENERITIGTAKEISKKEDNYDICVVVIVDEE